MNITKKFFKEQSGVAAIEFVFVLPILLILSFALIDYSRYILMQMKTIKAAYVIGDSITMSRPVEPDTTAADIASDSTYMTQDLLDNANGPDLIDNVPLLFLPFREAQGENLWQVVISHVRKPTDADPPQLTWQYDEDSRSFDANGRTSSVGVVSGFNNTDPATLPVELINVMGGNEDLIVVEVTAHYKPITPVLGALGVPFLKEKDMHYTSYMRSRYGNLQYIWSINCPPTSVNCP